MSSIHDHLSNGAGAEHDGTVAPWLPGEALAVAGIGGKPVDADTANADAESGTAIPARRAALPAVPDEPALRALIARIVAQDERALATLYDLASGRVYGLVLRIVRRPALAEEVVEDIFWQAWRQAPRFDAARGRVLTWLLTMARSRAIDALRRDAHFGGALAVDDAQCAFAVDEGPAVADLIDAGRGARCVQQALQALEPQARQLVALAFFRALTHEEIAQHTGLPLGTVKSLIRRALLSMRARVASPAAATLPARA